MRKVLVVCALLLSLFLTIGEAKATLLAVDGAGIPDNWGNQVTLDTETGLQWLNVFQVPVGDYHAYDLLMTSLSPGGQYYGWKLASATQVLTLFEHAGLPSNIFGFEDTAEQFSDAAIAFQRLLGSCWDGQQNNFCYTWGIVSDSERPGWLARVGLETWTDFVVRAGGNPAVFEDYYMKVFSSSDGVHPISIADYEEWNWGSNPLGAWLIREQPEAIPTPEPSTVLLMGFGLFGLAVWRKRRSL